MKYLLDTNIFIDAHKRYYQQNIVPSFGQWLVDDSDIYTLAEVKTEIKNGNDDLFELIKNLKVLPVGLSIKKVSDYITNHYTSQAEVSNF